MKFAVVVRVLSALSQAAIISATPLPCPDGLVDRILSGEIGPEACCKYGLCKADVVINMV